MADFKTVAQADELGENEAILVRYGRIPVIIFNIGGEYHAIEDKCTHADVALSGGEVNLNTCQITCPKHGAAFDIKTGQALSAPAVVPVMTFDVREHEGDIQLAPMGRRASRD